MTNLVNILLRNNLVKITADDDIELSPTSKNFLSVLTVLNNISYYGYALSSDAVQALGNLTPVELEEWWRLVERELKAVTGDDKKLGEFVVYKNFPTEVLNMSQAEYWFKQTAMYWGLPSSWFTQEEKERPTLQEDRKFKVLQLATPSAIAYLPWSLAKQPSKWTDQQFQDVTYLAVALDEAECIEAINFKENLVSFATFLMKEGIQVELATATDVLRLAAGLSDQDVSLKEKVIFKKFKRAERRFLLSCLEKCSNLKLDMASKPVLFKKLLKNLHPGDYKKSYPRVIEAYNDLYSDTLPETHNAEVEKGLLTEQKNVLQLMKTRPGDFTRRLLKAIKTFGGDAIQAYQSVIPSLNTLQLLTMKSFLRVAETREHRLYPPSGNWGKLKKFPNSWKLNQENKDLLISSINTELKTRLQEKFPEGVNTGQGLDQIKIKNNSSELSEYGRGTVFPIPSDVKFIRSASYWKVGHAQTCWFDNGWIFLDKNFKAVGTTCWCSNVDNTGYWNPKKQTNAATAFSGDPLSGNDKKGRACQAIDLYPERLKKLGVKYCIWNILGYSGLNFSQVEEVSALLQWGVDATAGKIFEPSRCQFNFRLHGESQTKYIAAIELGDTDEQHKLIYLDMNLASSVRSAKANEGRISDLYPALQEYMNSIPSLQDLFEVLESVDTGIPVMYSDEGIEIKQNSSAYVFKPSNKSNNFKQVDINSILMD